MKEKEMTPLGSIFVVDKEVCLKTIAGLSISALVEAQNTETGRGGNGDVRRAIVLELAKRADWQEIVSYAKKEEKE